MKKLILVVGVVGALAATAYSQRELITNMLLENDHTKIAKQFWYEERAKIKDGGSTVLHFSVPVNSLFAQVNGAQLQGGKYYFNTDVVINHKYIPMLTVVEPIDGKWVVNVDETFYATQYSVLNHYLDGYEKSMKSAAELIPTNYLVGIEGEVSSTQLESISAHLDAKLAIIKSDFIAQLIPATVGANINEQAK